MLLLWLRGRVDRITSAGAARNWFRCKATDRSRLRIIKNPQMDDILVDGDKPQYTAKGANTLRGGKRQYGCRILQGNFEEQRYEPGIYEGREFGSFVTEESAR